MQVAGGGAMVPQTGLKGTGVLVALAGPAGAGKSTLMAAARRSYSGNSAIVFPTSVSTRLAGVPPSGFEVATAEFELLEAAGAFLVSWRSHERSHGLPKGLGADLDAGRIAVVIVSRAVIGRLRRLHPRVHVVYVTASRDCLVERLTARTGTGPHYVRERLARADAFAIPEPPVSLIDNSGSLSEAVDEFFDVLEAYLPDRVRKVGD